MFKKCLLSAAVAMGVLASATASAGVYRLDFVASGFGAGSNQTPSVVDQVSGSIRFSSPENIVAVNNILGVSLVIDGHSYDVGGVAHNDDLPTVLQFGGANLGPNSASFGTNDFYLSYYLGQAGGYFSYTTASLSDAWGTSNVSYALAEVPEPAPAVLLMGALGALLLARRKTV